MTDSRSGPEQHKDACRKKRCLHHPAMECPMSDEPCIFEKEIADQKSHEGLQRGDCAR